MNRLIPVLIMVGAVTAVGAIRLLNERLHQRKIRALAKTLGGRMVFRLSAEYGLIPDPDGDFRVWRQARLMGYLSPCLALGRTAAVSMNMVVSTLNTGFPPDLPFIHRIGLRKITSNNERLNGLVRIRTDNPARAQVLLDDSANQNEIEYFLAQGYSWVIFQPDRVSVMKARYTDADLGPDLVRRHLTRLAQIKIR